jgi:putative transposase
MCQSLNNKQESYARQHCGVARHAWNWALGLCKEKLDKKEKLPSAIDLHKLLVKDVKSVNNWYYVCLMPFKYFDTL